MSEPLTVRAADAALAGERWPGGQPTLVLLHEGESDRRGWAEAARRLAPAVTVVAYDRRGFGETAVSAGPFTHVEDLLAELAGVADGPVWLAGASAGGGVAQDTVLTAPERVAGLVLFGTAVSGSPPMTDEALDPDTRRLGTLIEQAEAAGDPAEVNRLETWLWLDGPAQPEGRVGGAARDLALDMNGIIIRNGAPEDAGASGVDAWSRLAEVRVPLTVACGGFDLPFLLTRCRELAGRLPRGSYQELPGMAHQPYLEHPDQVAGLLLATVRTARAGSGGSGTLP